MITLTQAEVMGLGRCAQAMYARGQNTLGHLLSAMAASRTVPVTNYDSAMALYRTWLLFDEPKVGGAKGGYVTFYPDDDVVLAKLFSRRA